MSKDLAGKLSPRMEELCRLVARDHRSYKGAASVMGVSVHTVHNYAREIASRLDMPAVAAMHTYYWHVLHENGEGAA